MQQDNSHTTWSRPPDDLNLQSHQVDIWRILLDPNPDSVKWIESTLSADETQRASRFHFDADRHRFTAAHGSLRGILARYLGFEPRELIFQTNEYGKPSVPSDTKLEFNLSHSGRYALLAVTLERKVGIDVERIREDIELENLASRYFSRSEFSELMALPTEQRETAFFNCWTRKEAYIKAHGLGLSMPLDSFDVSLAPNEPAILHATRPDASIASRWSLLPLNVDSDYTGALAVEGAELEIRYWDWNTIQ